MNDWIRSRNNLAPEIADTEIAVKQAGRNYYMKKIWKIGVGGFACTALLVGSTIAAGTRR